MPIVMKGQTYYRTREVCEMVGVSRSTLLRWISGGLIRDASVRDRREWRLFTGADIKRIEDEAHKVNQSKSVKVGGHLNPFNKGVQAGLHINSNLER